MLQGSRTVGLALILAVLVLSMAAAENVVRPTVEVVPGTVDLAGAGQVRAARASNGENRSGAVGQGCAPEQGRGS